MSGLNVPIKLYEPVHDMCMFPCIGWLQESTSEAVNAYYAVSLLGHAMKDRQLAAVGGLLTAMEIRSAKTYWQITTPSKIYEEPFASNHVVGVLWSSKADYGTWFCGNVECMHGIQYLPFTPMSEALLSRDWLKQSWSLLQPALTRITDVMSEGFKAFIVCAHAVVDKNASWGLLQTVKQWSGLR